MVWTAPDFGKQTQAALRPARVGVTDCFLAPENTVYTADAGKIGKWLYLGRLEPGSYKNDFTRDFFDVKTGVPETTKESFVTALNGSVEFNLIEPTAKAYELANGGIAPVALFDTAPVSTTVAAGTITNGTIPLTSVTGLSVGDELEVDLSTGKEYTFITAINGTDVDVFPVLSAAPAATDDVKRVDGWDQPIGGSAITKYAFRSVFWTTENTALVTWLKSCRAGGIKDDFKDNKSNMIVPVTLMPFGYTDSALPAGSGPVLGKKLILGSALAADLGYTTTPA